MRARLPIAALGRHFGVSVRGMDAIIRLACIIHRAGYWRRGRLECPLIINKNSRWSRRHRAGRRLREMSKGRDLDEKPGLWFLGADSLRKIVTTAGRLRGAGGPSFRNLE